jgi:hypothetical protein
VLEQCSIPPTRLAFDNHLSWNRTDTPFLSLFNSWDKTLRWRKWLLDRDVRDIIIIAVWADDLHSLYEAEDIARTLRYNDSGQDRRRRLRNHRHEYLVWGGICADDYRILAVFPGNGPERPVPLCSRTRRVVANLPGDFASNAALRDVSEALLIEIYSCTGVEDRNKHHILVAYMGMT